MCSSGMTFKLYTWAKLDKRDGGEKGMKKRKGERRRRRRKACAGPARGRKKERKPTGVVDTSFAVNKFQIIGDQIIRFR